MLYTYEKGKIGMNEEQEKMFFNKILENRYKDTQYSIVKDGSSWDVYVIGRQDINDDRVYGGYAYHTKKSAIDAIESGRLLREIVDNYRACLYSLIALYSKK